MNADASLNYLQLALKLLKLNLNFDLFAAQINRQFSNFVAYKLDSKAKFFDSFIMDWFSLKFYAFPPVSVIQRELSKMKQDEAEGIPVVQFDQTKSGILYFLKSLLQFLYY